MNDDRDYWTMEDIRQKNLDVIDPTSTTEADRYEEAIAWTATEIKFAQEYLEPRLVDGKSVAWWAQPVFRLPFCTYTPDFAEMMADGRIIFWEVKGSYRLPSADRSSLAGRALLYFLTATNVVVRRANKRKKRTKAGKLWTIKTVSVERQEPPIPKEETDS